MATKAQQAERTNAINKLHEQVKAGATIYTVLRHVSRSGMQRSISLLLAGDEGIGSLDYWAARAMGDRIDPNNGGIKIGGCGMDMGFHLVYNLGRTLFPGGFGCVGPGCGSNDHSNGDRDYTPHLNGGKAYFEPGYVAHWHQDGGYALRHRWI